MRTALLSTFALAALAAGCPRPPAPDAGAPLDPQQLVQQREDARAGAPLSWDELLRFDFNRRAQELDLPLYWRADANKDKTLQPAELVVLSWPLGGKRSDYIGVAGFTPAFEQAWRAMLRFNRFEGLLPEERARREAVKRELARGRPTLVETDLSQASGEDKAVVGHLLDAAVHVERLYARQRGALESAARVPADDPLSRALFRRNQGPWCVAAKDEACSVVPGAAPPRVFGLYPAELQADPAFCEALAKQPDGPALAGAHFAVVVKDGEAFRSVPYTEVWKEDMEAVAKALDAAAAALSSKEEAAFKAYLAAAAAGFRTNDWGSADAAWVAMSGGASKWYARVGPDDVGFEPCAWKAGFALQLGRINPGAAAWKEKLEPVKGELEKAVAALAGPPYKARPAQLSLPDFVDVVLSAGERRLPLDAHHGQSLPAWGPAAEKGGHSAVMTNLGADADGQKVLQTQLEGLFCPVTMQRATTSPAPAQLTALLHEVGHHLGPSRPQAAKGPRDTEPLGGPRALMLDELKAHTLALVLSEVLADKKLLERGEVDAAHVREAAWLVEQLSRGLTDDAGRPSPQGQLAAIQFGWLLERGGLKWKDGLKAANGFDGGCLDVQLDRWRPSVEALAKRVLKLEAQGDRKDAEALVKAYVDDTASSKALRELLAKRWLQDSRPTFVYAVQR